MKREQFKHLFDESGLSFRDIAGLFSVSLGTVGRWYDGRSAPHSFGRKSILDRFNKKIQT